MKELIDVNKRIKDDLHRDINKTLDQYLDQLYKTEPTETTKQLLYENYYDSNGKIFMERPSLLTKLLDDSNVRAIYNIALSCLFLGCVRVIIAYSKEPSKWYSIQSYVGSLKFDKIGLFLNIWIKLFLLSLSIYPLSSLYYHSSKIRRHILAGFYCLYLMYFIWFGAHLIHAAQYNLIATLALYLEQVRMFMKIHSFFRENKKYETVDKRTFPSFTLYLYFLFAPTLIYRDSYPRTKTIKWNIVFSECLQIVLSLLFLFITLFKIGMPGIKTIFSRHNRYTNIFIEFVENSLPGTFVLLLTFYMFLHSWLNLWAELLYFSDRMFYTDWWNSISYTEYYKTWNIVVHDWLKTYIFNDLRIMLPGKLGKTIAPIAVIISSSIVHEYIVTMSIRSFCPGFMINFGVFGLILKFFSPERSKSNAATVQTWNALLWLSFMLGGGILMTLYAGEVYADTVCAHLERKSLIQYLKPRIFNKDCSYN